MHKPSGTSRSARKRKWQSARSKELKEQVREKREEKRE